MVRLGYQRYGAQGGDWGSLVTTLIGAQNLGHCAGIHLNSLPRMAGPGPDDMAELTPAELVAVERFDRFQNEGTGYSRQQSTRPQTVGYGLVDSPAAQAAWILEKFREWTDNDGDPEDAIVRDDLLDNVMIYWVNAAAASSARLYWESFGTVRNVTVPIPSGVSQFPKEIFSTTPRWASRVFSDIRYWNDLDRGGHFAAFEEPDLFVDEVRAFFRLVREGGHVRA